MKLQQAKQRFKELFAKHFHEGKTASQAIAAAKADLKAEGNFRGPAEWIALITALLPLIEQILAMFKKNSTV